MSCYNPTFVHRHIDNKTGEVTAKFIGNCKDNETLSVLLKSKYDGTRTNNVISLNPYDYYVQIPCGKCIGCRMDYSRSWADRMTYHSFGKEDCSYFFTLTYDDHKQEENDYNPLYDIYSLNYDHMTEFIKRLRNRFRDSQIDYYYSGEYGDSSFRNHFHMIVYNLFIPDLEFYKLNDLGDPLYTSNIIESLWTYGFCTIGLFNWRSAAYTARYVEKKRDGRAMVEYTALGLEPEKCRCSRRPGIAYDYYIDNYKDIWLNDGLPVDRTVNFRGHLGIPRYFRKLAHTYTTDRHGVKEVRGFDEFCEWQRKSLEHQNLLNPFNLDNSSFDLKHIHDMLSFEEREILSRKKQRNL